MRTVCKLLCLISGIMFSVVCNAQRAGVIESRKEGSIAKSINNKAKIYTSYSEVKLVGEFSQADIDALLSLPGIGPVDVNQSSVPPVITIDGSYDVRSLRLNGQSLELNPNGGREIHIGKLSGCHSIALTEGHSSPAKLSIDTLEVTKGMVFPQNVDIHAGYLHIGYQEMNSGQGEGQRVFIVPKCLEFDSLRSDLIVATSKSLSINVVYSCQGFVATKNSNPIVSVKRFYRNPRNSSQPLAYGDIQLKVNQLYHLNDNSPQDFSQDNIRSTVIEYMKDTDPEFSVVGNTDIFCWVVNKFSECGDLYNGNKSTEYASPGLQPDPEYIIRKGDRAVVIYHVRNYDESIFDDHVVEIFPGAFRDCASQIKSLPLEKSFITRLPSYALMNVDLSEISLPPTVERINPMAFKGSSIKTVNLTSKNPPVLYGNINLGVDEKLGREKGLSDLVFVIPNGSYDLYRDSKYSSDNRSVANDARFRYYQSFWERSIFKEEGWTIEYQLDELKPGMLESLLSPEIKDKAMILRLSGIIDEADLKSLSACAKLKVLDLTYCLPLKSEKQKKIEEDDRNAAEAIYGLMAQGFKAQREVRKELGINNPFDDYSYMAGETWAKALEKKVKERGENFADMFYLSEEAFDFPSGITDVYFPYVLERLPDVFGTQSFSGRQMGVIILPKNLKRKSMDHLKCDVLHEPEQ